MRITSCPQMRLFLCVFLQQTQASSALAEVFNQGDYAMSRQNLAPRASSAVIQSKWDLLSTSSDGPGGNTQQMLRKSWINTKHQTCKAISNHVRWPGLSQGCCSWGLPTCWALEHTRSQVRLGIRNLSVCNVIDPAMMLTWLHLASWVNCTSSPVLEFCHSHLCYFFWLSNQVWGLNHNLLVLCLLPTEQSR